MVDGIIIILFSCRFRYCSGDGVLLHASDTSGQIYITVGLNGTYLLVALSNGEQSQEVCVVQSHMIIYVHTCDH